MAAAACGDAPGPWVESRPSAAGAAVPAPAPASTAGASTPASSHARFLSVARARATMSFKDGGPRNGLASRARFSMPLTRVPSSDRRLDGFIDCDLGNSAPPSGGGRSGRVSSPPSGLLGAKRCDARGASGARESVGGRKPGNGKCNAVRGNERCPEEHEAMPGGPWPCGKQAQRSVPHCPPDRFPWRTRERATPSKHKHGCPARSRARQRRARPAKRGDDQRTRR